MLMYFLVLYSLRCTNPIFSSYYGDGLTFENTSSNQEEAADSLDHTRTDFFDLKRKLNVENEDIQKKIKTSFECQTNHSEDKQCKKTDSSGNLYEESGKLKVSNVLETMEKCFSDRYSKESLVNSNVTSTMSSDNIQTFVDSTFLENNPSCSTSLDTVNESTDRCKSEVYGVDYSNQYCRDVGQNESDIHNQLKYSQAGSAHFARQKSSSNYSVNNESRMISYKMFLETKITKFKQSSDLKKQIKKNEDDIEIMYFNIFWESERIMREIDKRIGYINFLKGIYHGETQILLEQLKVVMFFDLVKSFYTIADELVKLFKKRRGVDPSEYSFTDPRLIISYHYYSSLPLEKQTKYKRDLRKIFRIKKADLLIERLINNQKQAKRKIKESDRLLRIGR